MSRSLLSRFRSWTLHFALVGGLSLGACQSSQRASRELGEGVKAPSLCPTCDPQAGGETGDFSGSSSACEAMSSAIEVDDEAALALGFDLPELERRALRPIELPMRWYVPFPADGPFAALAASAGDPATGYDENTQISATLSATGVLRHVRPDPALCDGETCRKGGAEIPEASCPDRLELGIRAEVHTHDGALHATTEGYAALVRRAPSEDSFEPPRFSLSTRADLRDVRGTLVLSPRPGALRYEGTLYFYGSLLDDTCEGELSPNIMISNTESSGVLYHPLYGHFPPVEDAGAQVSDAGMVRGDAAP